MGALYGLWRREKPDELRRHRRIVARAANGDRELSWFSDRLPDEVVDALCWPAYEAGRYDDTVRVKDDNYAAVRDALDSGAAVREQYDEQWTTRQRHDLGYGTAFREMEEAAEAEMAVIDDYMADIRAWRDVQGAWLDAAETAVDHLYTVNPFEAERLEQTVKRQRAHNAALEEYSLRHNRLDQVAAEAKWDRDMQMFGAVKGGIWGGIGAMVVGLPVVGTAVGAAGPFAALWPARQREAEQDAVGAVRAQYRVAEIREELDGAVVRTVPSGPDA